MTLVKLKAGVTEDMREFDHYWKCFSSHFIYFFVLVEAERIYQIFNRPQKNVSHSLVQIFLMT